MPIKKDGNYENVLVTFRKTVKKQLDEYQKNYAPQMNRSEFINYILQQYLLEKTK